MAIDREARAGDPVDRMGIANVRRSLECPSRRHERLLLSGRLQQFWQVETFEESEVLRDSAPEQVQLQVAEVPFRPSVPKLKMASTVARANIGNNG